MWKHCFLLTGNVYNPRREPRHISKVYHWILPKTTQLCCVSRLGTSLDQHKRFGQGKKRHMQLFSPEIDSRDICQGMKPGMVEWWLREWGGDVYIETQDISARCICISLQRLYYIKICVYTFIASDTRREISSILDTFGGRYLPMGHFAMFPRPTRRLLAAGSYCLLGGTWRCPSSSLQELEVEESGLKYLPTFSFHKSIVQFIWKEMFPRLFILFSWQVWAWDESCRFSMPKLIKIIKHRIFLHIFMRQKHIRFSRDMLWKWPFPP